MEIDHSTTNLLHILYHVGYWLLVAGLVISVLVLAFRVGISRFRKHRAALKRMEALNREERRRDSALDRKSRSQN